MLDIIVPGIAGMALVLIAFALNEMEGPVNTQTIEYNLLNAIGSALLLYYAYATESMPFIILNSVWFLVASVKIFRISKNIIHKGA